ncbi:MAG TPA: CoA ester lyase [Vicinamibacterales bacterium]|nr:CoA ester lyase [Vicinamibacterales bacterium]
MIAPFPRTLLFAPAHRARFVESAFRSDADAVVLDLEDAVPEPDKAAARSAAARIVKDRRDGVPVIVRINAFGMPEFEADLGAMADSRPAAVMLPKVETPDPIERARSMPPEVGLVLLIESPAGILRALDLARVAGPRLIALAFGAEDYRASMRLPPEDGGPALEIARAMLAMAAAAAGVTAIDSPSLQLDDPEALTADSRRARALGFQARLAIHPAQVRPIAEAFAPDPVEREWANGVIRAAAAAKAPGQGALRVDGRMIDAATLRRAQRIVDEH